MSVEISDRSNQDILDTKCRDKDHHDDDVCCVCKRVRQIDRLQRKFGQEAGCLSCESHILGSNAPGVNEFNTRPFILYTEDGTVFSTVTSIDPTDQTPETVGFVYRVEEVRECCAVLRVLTVTGTTPVRVIGAVVAPTNMCITVDLCEFIAIQCLPDTFLSVI